MFLDYHWSHASAETPYTWGETYKGGILLTIAMLLYNTRLWFGIVLRLNHLHHLHRLYFPKPWSTITLLQPYLSSLLIFTIIPLSDLYSR